MSMVLRLFVCDAHGSGRSSAISRSNSKNVIAIRKNFMENGSRADPMGSNPHSYGVIFSEYVFNWGSQKAINMSRDASMVLVIITKRRFIVFFWALTRAC